MPNLTPAASFLQVLLVEDDPLDAALMERHLNGQAALGATIQLVDNREDFLRGLDDSPDIILCDYQLNNFTGLDALRLMRDRQLDIPFILVSGTIGEEIAVEAMRNGASDYLLKDRLGRLASAITRAIEEKKLRGAARNAEEDLRQSELKYRSLFEHVPDAAYLCDAVTGRIIDTNRSGEEMLGEDRSGLLGLRLPRLLSIQDWGALVSVAGNPSPTPASLGMEMTRLDGNRIRLQARATTILLYDRRLLLAFFREG